MRKIFQRIVSSALVVCMCLMFMPVQPAAAATSVASVGGVKYSTLNSAIEAAAATKGTVTLLNDTEVVGAFIPKGVTLDLANYTLTAGYLIGLKGSYLTATPNAGKLVIEKDSLVLPEQGYKNADEQYVLPVWNPEQNCYVFSLFVLNTDPAKDRGLKVDEANETIYFQFKHQATGAINRTLLADGAGDNALKVIVRLVWNTDDGAAYQDFVYNDRFVGEVTGSKDYTFTLTGYSALNINLDTLSVTAMIVTESGAVASGDVWTMESGAAAHTVTFADYDGTVLKKQMVWEGKSAAAPADPSRDGYTFTGWDKAFDRVTSSLTVTAQYERNVSADPAVCVGDVTAQAGQTVSVPVVIKNNPGVAGAKIKIAFDSRLTLVSATKGDAFAVLDYTAPASLKNGAAFNWDSLDTQSNVDGTILTLEFEVPANAERGDTFAVSFSYRNGDIYDVNLDDVSLNMVSGTITVN